MIRSKNREEEVRNVGHGVRGMRLPINNTSGIRSPSILPLTPTLRLAQTMPQVQDRFINHKQYEAGC